MRAEGALRMEKAGGSSGAITSTEMLAMGGFGLSISWVLIVFYWLFCGFPTEMAVPDRGFVQLFSFAAMALGYVVAHFLGRNPAFNVFTPPVRIAEGACACLLPAIAFAMLQGLAVPVALVCATCLLAGAAAAGIKLSWLDVCSRLDTTDYERVTSISLIVGGLLFVLVAFTPTSMQPLFGIAYIVLSVVLLGYGTKSAPRNDERAPLESVANTWRFTAELEPSFFMFGVVFSLTFVYLFNEGPTAVMCGLVSTLAGSLVVAVISAAGKRLPITTYQRILVVITVIACVSVPYIQASEGRVALSCVVTAAWAMFMAVNHGYIVRKCVLAWEAPLFRQAPLRLFVPSCGFATGWAIATILTWLFGIHSDAFLYLRLVVAVLLVSAIMLFFPSRTHHPVDGSSPAEAKVQTMVVSHDCTEKELFEARCAAVAKLYQLSPRETEILGYIAKGRNAAYIQEALVISPHTVKSHIYNIYRKVDIHSQQKLMDFVEEFPLDDV